MSVDWWTLGLQAVNVLVLIWLLGRFFWKPVAAIIEERRDAVHQSLASAKASRAQAEAEMRQIEATRAGFAAEREAMLAAAREAVEKERAALLAKANAEAAAIQDAAKDAIAAEGLAAEAAWGRKAAELSVDIARRLVGRLDGPALREAFADGLVEQIEALDPRQRADLAAPQTPMTVVSADTLDAAAKRTISRRLGEVLGCEVKPRFAVRPDLIAGLDLRTPHLVVANNWQADLGAIHEELVREQ